MSDIMESEDQRFERKARERAASKLRQIICADCQKHPRQNGSRRCRPCSDIYKEQQRNDRILQEKIAASTLPTNNK